MLASFVLPPLGDRIVFPTRPWIRCLLFSFISCHPTLSERRRVDYVGTNGLSQTAEREDSVELTISALLFLFSFNYEPLPRKRTWPRRNPFSPHLQVLSISLSTLNPNPPHPNEEEHLSSSSPAAQPLPLSSSSSSSSNLPLRTPRRNKDLHRSNGIFVLKSLKTLGSPVRRWRFRWTTREVTKEDLRSSLYRSMRLPLSK